MIITNGGEEDIQVSTYVILLNSRPSHVIARGDSSPRVTAAGNPDRDDV